MAAAATTTTARRVSIGSPVPILVADAEQDGDGERPRKRQRLPNHGIPAAISVREAKPDTALEVDYMILDYLAFQATEACLDARNSRPHDTSRVESRVGRSLLLVDDFMILFTARHRGCKIDEELQFRLSHLQLVTLFTQRLRRTKHTPALNLLKDLRNRNTHRAQRWIGSADRMPTGAYEPDHYDTELPISREALESNRASTLQALRASAEDEAYGDAFYGTASCLSLLDLLPSFMKLTAACQSMYDTPISEQWMTLAAQWMLQACLEQYLVFGASGTDAIDEAFAWGAGRQIASDRETPTSEPDSDMFMSDGVEVDFWAETKASFLRQLLVPPTRNGRAIRLVEHLMVLATHLPADRTEASIVDYLGDMSKAIPAPVLVQLEHGRLDGLSEEETSDFLKECGLELPHA